MLEATPPLHTLPLAFFTAKSGDTRKVSRESLDRLIALEVPFWSGDVPWTEVQRCLFFAYQQFQYVYPSPAHNLEQTLMVMPKQHYGGQRLRDLKISSEPIPLERRVQTDFFGNTQHHFLVAQISHWTSFEVMFCVENNLAALPLETNPAPYLLPTSLTTPDKRLLEVAKHLKQKSSSALEYAQRVSDWISQTMQYQHGITNVGTSAAQALEVGAGLCQDYSHIMLALCRAAGVAARYVSGHMLGEGASHAWCEVLLEQETVGFDPTNARQPNLGYTVVALGRDYNDVPPTSGRFVGDSAGVLHFEKYAGLLEIELMDGQILTRAN